MNKNSNTSETDFAFHQTLATGGPAFIAARLLQARIGRSWSVGDLAQRSNVPAAHIREIEAGAVALIPPATLYALARALEVPVLDIVGSSEAPEAQDILDLDPAAATPPNASYLLGRIREVIRIPANLLSRSQ